MAIVTLTSATQERSAQFFQKGAHHEPSNHCQPVCGVVQPGQELRRDAHDVRSRHRFRRTQRRGNCRQDAGHPEVRALSSPTTPSTAKRFAVRSSTAPTSSRSTSPSKSPPKPPASGSRSKRSASIRSRTTRSRASSSSTKALGNGIGGYRRCSSRADHSPRRRAR